MKSECDIPSTRIVKHERTPARRWHFEIRLERPDDVDRQLNSWIEAAYALAE